MRLEVLAYNVCACPMHFGHFVTWRPPAPWRFREGLIAERLVDYDVVGLAEMFLPDANLLRQNLGAPTHVVGPGPRPLAPLSSGVEVASKLPLAPVEPVRMHFSERGARWCGFAAKGALLVRLEIPGGRLAVVATHLQAGMGNDQIRARCRQIRELRELIDEHVREEAVIVMGDLNVDGNADDPDTRVLRELFSDFTDVAIEAGVPFPTWDPRSNVLATDFPQRLDYILYRAGARVSIELRSASLALTERVRNANLSDHYGIRAALEVNAQPAVADRYLKRIAPAVQAAV